MNASLFQKNGGHWVRLYIGDTVVDEAGPFDEPDDAEYAAHRMVDGTVTRGAYEVAENFATGGDE